jgi:hypothetical protein
MLPIACATLDTHPRREKLQLVMAVYAFPGSC